MIWNITFSRLNKVTWQFLSRNSRHMLIHTMKLATKTAIGGGKNCITIILEGWTDARKGGQRKTITLQLIIQNKDILEATILLGPWELYIEA